MAATPQAAAACERGPQAADEALEALVQLIADRLRQERASAEQRHAWLCEALRRDLDAVSFRAVLPIFGPDHAHEDSDASSGKLLKRCASPPSFGEDMLPGELEGPRTPLGPHTPPDSLMQEELRWDQAEVVPLSEMPVFEVSTCHEGPDTGQTAGDGESPPMPAQCSEQSEQRLLTPSGKKNSARLSEAFKRSWSMTPKLDHTPTTSKLSSSPKSTSGKNCLESFVLGSYFELFFGALILANAAIMAIEVQYNGMHNEKLIGFMNASMDTPVEGWPNAELSFMVLDWVFGLTFASEVLLKILVMRSSFLLSLWNYFDTVIVAIWFLASLASLGFAMNPLVLRAFRFARLLRLVRLMKMTSWFDTLVLMVSSIQASVFVLLWGVVLLVLTMTMCALMLNSILTSFMLDEDEPEHIRHEVFMYMGTYSRSMVTMFEITLGNWVPLCRLLGDHVNEGLTIFFLAYRCVVGFAVMNVIKGVFLHETFRCAGLDDDLMVLHRRRMRAKFKDKMMQFFTEADTGDDGEISMDEFCAMVDDDRVNTWLEAMDLRVRDVGAERVFAFLAGGDEILSRTELCTGMSRLRGAAQGLDVISILGLTAPDIAAYLPVPVDVVRLRYDLPRKSQLPPMPDPPAPNRELLMKEKTPPDGAIFHYISV